jgi:hypothetical protein
MLVKILRGKHKGKEVNITGKYQKTDGKLLFVTDIPLKNYDTKVKAYLKIHVNSIRVIKNDRK